MDLTGRTFTFVTPPTTSLQGKIIQKLGQGKFSTYLADISGQYFSVKVFPLGHELFKTESCFVDLEHHRLASPLFSTQGDFDVFGTIESYSIIITDYCPNGDFFNFFIENQLYCDEKLVRTYFRQLVEAIEYMHAVETAHLDIKLENVFLENDYSLKLGDFDLSYKVGDVKLSKGTMDARAPEVITQDDYDPYKADVFSMGVFLYTLMHGLMPFAEKSEGIYEMLQKNSKKFWRTMWESVLKVEGDIWSNDFKTMFEGMTKRNTQERYGIKEIKGSNWYNDEVYDDSELPQVIKEMIENRQ